MKNWNHILVALSIVFFLCGCASIPQESVTLNSEISTRITSLHRTNVALVNQYFAIKKDAVDQYEAQALNSFFGKIAAATTDPNAPPLGAHDLYKIKEKIDDIHQLANKYKAELDTSEALIINRLSEEYNLLIGANSTITALLQSAVDVDKAKDDGLLKLKKLSNDKIDLTDIDEKVDNFISTMGTTSVKTTSLIDAVRELLNEDKGE